MLCSVIVDIPHRNQNQQNNSRTKR